jgi:hypothetical protein
MFRSTVLCRRRIGTFASLKMSTAKEMPMQTWEDDEWTGNFN